MSLSDVVAENMSVPLNIYGKSNSININEPREKMRGERDGWMCLFMVRCFMQFQLRYYLFFVLYYLYNK